MIIRYTFGPSVPLKEKFSVGEDILISRETSSLTDFLKMK